MPTVNEVADYLIRRAYADGELLSNLRLQKLCYYCQGWHLAHLGEPLFNERVEAWAHGPVVPELYQRFKGYRHNFIPVKQATAVGGISNASSEVLDEVWNIYGDYSAKKLEDLTHDEAPWINARQGADPVERLNTEITLDSMRVFFAAKLLN